MGNQCIAAKDRQFSVSGFKKLCCIGIGGFSQVWKVTELNTKRVYALKQIQKALVIGKHMVSHTYAEMRILSSLCHPFLINLHRAFADRCFVYLLLDYAPKQDLAYHLCHRNRFSEEQTKFFVACILVALEYIHGQGVVHRDVKPHNLLFDEEGYLRLSDFGIAKTQEVLGSADTSGTSGYASPEVVEGRSHGPTTDYFAVGVIVHQCMLGKAPYSVGNRKRFRDEVSQAQAQVKEKPSGWSSSAVDFCNQLIQHDPANRLGANGFEEVQSHRWFDGFPWDKLRARELEPPFVPRGRRTFSAQDLARVIETQKVWEKKCEVKTNNQFSGFKFMRTPIA